MRRLSGDFCPIQPHSGNKSVDVAKNHDGFFFGFFFFFGNKTRCHGETSLEKKTIITLGIVFWVSCSLVDDYIRSGSGR